MSEVYETKKQKMSLLRELETSSLAEPLDKMDKTDTIPVPFEYFDLPEFPLLSLPDRLKNYVAAIAESTQTLVDMAAVAALTVMALCCQGKYIIEGKPDWHEPLNLFSVIIARPAERKSAIMRALTFPIIEYEREENARLKDDIDKSRAQKEMLAQEVSRLTKMAAKGSIDKIDLCHAQKHLSSFKEVKPVRYLADDVTPEALSSLMADNDGRIGVISSEGGIFDILRGRYSTTINLDCFLKGHCGDSLRIDRKGRESESIDNPCLTVLLAIQPQVLEGLLENYAFRGRGLTARFLYSFPASKVGKRNFETAPISEESKESYKALCHELLALSGRNTILKLSEEAHSLSAEFATWLEPLLINELEGLGDWAGKLHGTILRIAGILHVVENLANSEKVLVSGSTMYRAIDIGRYFLSHAKSAFLSMGADCDEIDAKIILEKLSNHKQSEMSARDIYRLCRGRFKNAAEILPGIDILVGRGYLIQIPAQEQNKVGRKPSPMYKLHPVVLGR